MSYLTLVSTAACGVDLVRWILWLMLGMLVLAGWPFAGMTKTTKEELPIEESIESRPKSRRIDVKPQGKPANACRMGKARTTVFDCTTTPRENGNRPDALPFTWLLLCHLTHTHAMHKETS